MFNNTEFSKRIGNKRPDGLYKILKNEARPTPKTLGKIKGAFSEYYSWLLTGEGDMLREGGASGGVSVNNSGISHSNLGNINNKGGSVSVGADGNGLDRMIEQQKGLIESLKASQEQLSNSQRQIDKLIAIISEKLK